jgi:hypothetical protein
MVVAGADDQVTAAGLAAVGEVDPPGRPGRRPGRSARRGCGGTVRGAMCGPRPSAARQRRRPSAQSRRPRWAGFSPTPGRRPVAPFQAGAQRARRRRVAARTRRHAAPRSYASAMTAHARAGRAVLLAPGLVSPWQITVGRSLLSRRCAMAPPPPRRAVIFSGKISAAIRRTGKSRVIICETGRRASASQRGEARILYSRGHAGSRADFRLHRHIAIPPARRRIATSTERRTGEPTGASGGCRIADSLYPLRYPLGKVCRA